MRHRLPIEKVAWRGHYAVASLIFSTLFRILRKASLPLSRKILGSSPAHPPSEIDTRRSPTDPQKSNPRAPRPIHPRSVVPKRPKNPMKPLFESDPRIDVSFLFGKFPDLALLERQGFHLDAIGNELVRRRQGKQARQKREPEVSDPKSSTELLDWSRIKAALHQIICTSSQDFEEIRGRLRNHAGATTPHLLATLSLWLAGFLGMSIATASPLVATVLLGIARGGVDGWYQIEEPVEA